MAEVPLNEQTSPGSGDAPDAAEPGRLLRQAARLLEAADLPGANETLKKAEKALVPGRNGPPAPASGAQAGERVE